MCSIHESRCTSHWHSRPKSIARNDLPRWTSSAQPQCSKIVDVRREIGTSDPGVRLGSPIDSRAETPWRVFALRYLVTLGILPNASFICQNRVCKFGEKCSFPHRKVRNNQTRSRRRVVSKVQWLQWKMCDSWVVYFRTQNHRNLHRFYGEAKKSWDQFDEYESRMLRSVLLTSEKNKGPSLGKIQVKLPHQRSTYALKFEDRSHEES